MRIDSNKLKTVSNFAEEKGFTRQHVYRLIKSGDLNSIEIDGVHFIIIDEKSNKLERKRAKK
jgi:hypothetical protein